MIVGSSERRIVTEVDKAVSTALGITSAPTTCDAETEVKATLVNVAIGVVDARLKVGDARAVLSVTVLVVENLLENKVGPFVFADALSSIPVISQRVGGLASGACMGIRGENRWRSIFTLLLSDWRF